MDKADPSIIPEGRTPLLVLEGGRNEQAICDVYIDVCKRITACRMCAHPILKKQRRLVFIANHPTTHLRDRAYMHPACFIEAMGETGPTPWNHCYDCGIEVVKKGQYRCWTGNRFGTAVLCVQCAGNARWVICNDCHTAFPPGKTTWVLPPQSPRRICERCAEILSTFDNVRTLKDKRQEDRTERKFQELRSTLEEAHNGSR